MIKKMYYKWLRKILIDFMCWEAPDKSYRLTNSELVDVYLQQLRDRKSS